MIKATDTIIVRNSANGTAIQTPTTSNNCGSISNATDIKTNVRNVEITADTLQCLIFIVNFIEIFF